MYRTKKVPDDSLVNDYLSGRKKAFDELLARHQTKLFSYILFMVRDEDRANDLFQETFVKVISYLHEGKYTANGKFYSWMACIAHNVVVDYFRESNEAKFYDAPNENNLSNTILWSVEIVSREEELVSQQVLADVRKLMESLPASQREIVYMRYYQDLTFKEIAEVLGISINTALGRMRYALINMRKLARKHDMALNVI